MLWRRLSTRQFNTGMLCLQAAKRLAQTAIDVQRDVARLQTALHSFVALSKADSLEEVEDTLADCLMEPLELTSMRMFCIDSAKKTATAVGDDALKTSWKPGTEQTSIVAWCAPRSIDGNPTF